MQVSYFASVGLSLLMEIKLYVNVECMIDAMLC